MNFKNYKLEVLTLIDEYKKSKASENSIEDDDTLKSIDEIENAIKLLDDNDCLNTEFLDDIWSHYCKFLPYSLVVALFNYTSFKTQTVCWEIPNKQDIIFNENLSYKINMPTKKLNGILKTDIGDTFYDVLDIHIIFDLNSK